MVKATVFIAINGCQRGFAARPGKGLDTAVPFSISPQPADARGERLEAFTQLAFGR
jgi:hypothetical protein